MRQRTATDSPPEPVRIPAKASAELKAAMVGHKPAADPMARRVEAKASPELQTRTRDWTTE